MWSQYRRTLLAIVLAVFASSVMMVLAAGGSPDEAVLVGGVGLLFGVAVAGYVYHLIGQLRRR